MSAIDALAYFLDTAPEIGAEGAVLFMRAQPHESLRRFTDRLSCEQTWKPRADALRAAGFESTKSAEGTFPTVLLLPDRQRESIHGDLATAQARLAPSGNLVVSLANGWGAKRIEQQVANLAGEVRTLSKHHCRVFWAAKRPERPWAEATLTEWREAARLRRILDGRFWSRPGLFHWDNIDPGSLLLTQHLPPTLAGAVADLGCGWGFLGDHVLRHCPDIRTLDCYDADSDALEAARRNLGLIPVPARVRLHWHDVAAGLGAVRYDSIIMNPPFHEGRDSRPELGLRFITAAAMALDRTGDLWLVANQQLPYEPLLQELFSHVSLIANAGGFKVLRAAEPRPEVQRRHRADQHKGQRKSRR